jgi:hypothetical protein
VNLPRFETQVHSLHYDKPFLLLGQRMGFKIGLFFQHVSLRPFSHAFYIVVIKRHIIITVKHPPDRGVGLSASTISRLKGSWTDVHGRWFCRSLACISVCAWRMLANACW